MKAEYVAGGISIRKLAAKYGVPVDTAEKRSRREKWGELRRKTGSKVAEELPSAIASAVVANAAQWAEKHSSGFDQVWGLVLAEVVKLATTNALTLPGNKDDKTPAEEHAITPNERLLGFRRAISAMRDAQTGIRKALGLDKGDGETDPTEALDALAKAMQLEPDEADDE
jgi:hypothetical protein